jgi:rhodanese-related sulfurtransferase
MVASISAGEFQKLVASGSPMQVIDVRTPVEFREVHVGVARNEPLERLDTRAIKSQLDRSGCDKLYVLCRSGSRGKQACEKLLASGLTNVINVEGGTMACVEAGVGVVRGKKAISLERQVRIAAGLLVVTGAALGFFVNTYWIGLSAFVGAGLVFAGVTDTCGMAMMLAKMPWNQVKSEATCSPAPSSV